MKKFYETPSVEKIAFRYRDQVVAASGVAAMSEEDTGTNYNSEYGTCFTGEELLNDIRNMTLWDLCSAWA